VLTREEKLLAARPPVVVRTDRSAASDVCNFAQTPARRQEHPLLVASREVTIVSIVSLYPDTSKSGNTDQETFEREVAARFGLVPNFFRSAPEAPLVIRELWLFAKSAYLDTPIPTLFKERLFVYLSRFCEVRYCITRHCGFLLGLGRSAVCCSDRFLPRNARRQRWPGWKPSQNRSIGPCPKPHTTMIC
jgi:hypothetical protein